MRFQTWLLLAAVVATGGAFAKDLPPWPLRDQGKVYVAKTRQFNFKDYRPIGIEHSVPCRVRFVDPYFGYLDDATYYRLGKMPLQSNCYDMKTANLLGSAPVRFDEGQQRWVRYIGNALKRWGNDLRPDEVRAIDESIQVYSLNNANSKGFAYTEDPWTGDESGRTRTLDYCLFHGEVALCGHGEVGALVDGRRGDLSSYVLQMLRSIEFIEDKASGASSSSVDEAASSVPH